MKAVARTGLVPVKSRATGAIFGVTPARAIAGVASREVTLVPIPPDVETIETAGPAISDAKSVSPEKPAGLFNGQVEIPADWAIMHHLKRVALARQIARVEKLEPPDDMKPLEYADFIIDREVKARVAAASGDDGTGGEGTGDGGGEGGPGQGGDQTKEPPAASPSGDQTKTQTDPPPAPSAADGGGEPTATS